MFIHSVPDSAPAEIQIFRPYGKATIWEQRNLLELGAQMGSQVFLWECMALNPHYVDLLQRAWMQDDIATVTNAYPDHENIQGPTGRDVAEAITQFVPTESTLITSEINFLPLFRDACARKKTKFMSIGEYAGDLVADDLLDLFPYQEHPRNIALVAKLAHEVGLDPQLAVVVMADNVVPDIGVLRSYPQVRLRGRRLRFTNGCSANERAGFLASWQRIGLDLSPDADPETMVVTVVNNRDDRVARSEVFSRILVEDLSVDRHVIIGTNISGLLGFIRSALDDFLSQNPLLTTADLSDPQGQSRAETRLSRMMARFRIPTPSWDALRRRLIVYAHGCGLEAHPTEGLETCCRGLLENPSDVLALAAVRSELGKDAQLRQRLGESITARASEAAERKGEPPEVDRPAERTELEDHFLDQLARQVVASRLRATLAQAFMRRDQALAEGFQASFREVYRALFLSSLEVVQDPKTKGDEIARRCASCVPPGTRVEIMGTQNIKGTGLDFVYRWISVQTVSDELARFETGHAEDRLAALRALVGFEDHGQMDMGLISAFLGHFSPRNDVESALADELRAKADAFGRKSSDPDPKSRAKKSAGGGLLAFAEGWLDFLDATNRYRKAQVVLGDLRHRRISHRRAALRMREIQNREKGGWLRASFSLRKRRS
jgi:poly-gamma-glutamate synthase PgsB/CapB